MTDKKQTPLSLATGAKLTQATWDDFVTRLRHDCEGKGVEQHCTADAIFIVQAKQIVSGIDKDYTDMLLAYRDDSSWNDPKEYWTECDVELRGKLDKAAMEYADQNFMDLATHSQWDVLENMGTVTVTGYLERWSYVNAHLTMDAAEAFIARKKHDYPEGLRVYVNSQYYAWEFNALKAAILAGRLTFNESTP